MKISRVLAVLAAGFLCVTGAHAAADGSDTAIWGKVKNLLVGDRTVIDDTTGAVVELGRRCAPRTRRWCRWRCAPRNCRAGCG